MKRMLDAEKALETLVYVASLEPDLYKALKAIYFADKEHLKNYGRLIYGETYNALPNGPLPSRLYDYLKSVRGDGKVVFSESLQVKLLGSFKVGKKVVKVLRKPNLDYLSESEIKCLNIGYLRVRGKTFDEVKAMSHDAAHESTPRNKEISLEKIVKTLPNSDMILSYLNDC